MKKSLQSQLVKSLPWGLLAIWVLFTPSVWKLDGHFHQINSVGSFFGAASFIFFGFSLFFVTKLRKLEDCVGGLDKAFQYHQFLGKVGFVCLLIHVFTFALKWASRGVTSYFLYVLPLHDRLSMNLGSYAFIFTTLILTITIFKLLPYHIWKRVHRLMGVVFFLSFLHFFLSYKTLGSGLSNAILYFAAFIGLVSVIYKQFLFPFFVRYFKYTVVKTEVISETLQKITLRTKNRTIRFFPGQYAFIHFEEAKFSQEQHPFTLARNGESNDLFIYVKNRGDYTEAIRGSLQPNWTAFLEGPYGRLDYRSHQKQIWIAGGIGIALFLSWMHSVKPNHGKTIDLFFCCHNRADLAVLEEFEVLKQGVSGIQVFTFCSEDNKRLSTDEIIKACPDYKKRKFFMCGPRKLTYDMRKKLVGLSVKKTNIEYEDFNFF